MKRDAWQVDAQGFLFTLVNSQGLPPAKFASTGHANGLYTGGSNAFLFGGGDGGSLFVKSNSDSSTTASSKITGACYAAPAAGGAHILAGSASFSVAETVAWVIPQ